MLTSKYSPLENQYKKKGMMSLFCYTDFQIPVKIVNESKKQNNSSKLKDSALLAPAKSKTSPC